MLPRSLYVHVPFCTRRCSYCDFAVDVAPEPPTGEWLRAVGGELALTARERGWAERLPLDTLYVGGGTPSLLGEGAMAGLAEALSPHAASGSGMEWTCEANPESFTPALARDWRAAGVNRLSLGAQSFHEPVLRWMGRMHGAGGPARAVAAARAAGFDNLSVDLIFGVPARLGRDWAADLEAALALRPEHISLYGLTAEAATPLGRWVREGRESLADEDRYAEEYLLAHRVLTAAGFEHYEVSNFALPGRRSRHNFVYWTGAPYAALGPGAHAFHPPLRRWNLRAWEAYREAISHGQLPIGGEERVSAEDALLERIWLGLRTDRGLPLDDVTPVQRDLGRLWTERGWAAEHRRVLRLTAEGWLLLDRLAVDFASAGELAVG
ncbi:MAG TPA: radical SAM family heme chaperone HemW [Longimicrobiaceae bacterium]|nr:radical SAM family heme chaperone HemW [Longimicrobiaceae bacterium]